MRSDLIIRSLSENSGKIICLYNSNFTIDNIRSFLRDNFNLTPKIKLLSSGITYSDEVQFYFIDSTNIADFPVNNDQLGNIVLLGKNFPIISTEKKENIFLYPC